MAETETPKLSICGGMNCTDDPSCGGFGIIVLPDPDDSPTSLSQHTVGLGITLHIAG
jgi:hypothetical protein